MTTEVDPLDLLPSGVKLLLMHLHALIPKKLSDINYPTWKITVLTALETNYLLKYVDGSTEPLPAATITKGTKTMAEYLDEVSTIITALDTMNEIIPEKDLVMCVVRGLPSAYSSIKL